MFNPNLSRFQLVESSPEEPPSFECGGESGRESGPDPDREIGPAETNRSLRRLLELHRETAARERADLEARLAKAEERHAQARAALDRRAEALARMSHEIRTPMNGILGMTRLALQTELSEKQREYLEEVNASGDALLTLINDTLDLSKLGAGRLTLEAIPFDLRSTLESAIKSLSLQIEDKGLGIETTVTDEVPGKVVGDPGRLRQVLLNLVSNAVKFSDRGRVRVTVEAETAGPGGLQLHFRVSDDGIGIPADRIGAIFEPYAQAMASTSREHGGTGLGLAICRDLVDLMGGRIWAESVEGEGATFHFTALFGEASAGRGEALAPVDELDGLVVYLLAAEGPACALAQQLDPAGIRPSMFDRVETALRAMSERRPDILVIDLDRYKLRHVDRLDREVRKIVVASSGQRGDAARCREAGVAAYLTRPLGPLDLRDAVRAVVTRTDSTLVTRHWLRERRVRPRVLAADDSAVNRDLLTRLLESQGCVVVTVSDGRKAVEAFDPALFDLILMDIEMPNMTGIEAARALRSSGAQVPIIALTGHLSPERINSCREAGMTGHLAKPFKLNDLIDTIESAAKGAQAAGGG